MPQPVKHAPRRQRRPPRIAVEKPVAPDPVERQRPGEATLLVGPGIAEVTQPVERLQVVLPVVMIDFERERRHPVRIDQLAGQQVPALHHLEHGLAVGGAELAQRTDHLLAGGTRPGPADERIGDQVVGGRKQGSACEETQRICQVSTSSQVARPERIRPNAKLPSGGVRAQRRTRQGYRPYPQEAASRDACARSPRR